MLADILWRQLDSFLCSRLGGKKDRTQRTQICVDVLKYLFFANSSVCDLDALLSQTTICSFIDWLKKERIGASGILTKLRRIDLALSCLCLESDSAEHEAEVQSKREEVESLIATYRTSFKREKVQTQRKNMDKFSAKVPGLKEVTKFLTDVAVTDFLKIMLEEAQSGQFGFQAQLKDAMYIITGHLMLW